MVALLQRRINLFLHESPVLLLLSRLTVFVFVWLEAGSKPQARERRRALNGGARRKDLAKECSGHCPRYRVQSLQSFEATSSMRKAELARVTKAT